MSMLNANKKDSTITLELLEYILDTRKTHYDSRFNELRDSITHQLLGVYKVIELNDEKIRLSVQNHVQTHISLQASSDEHVRMLVERLKYIESTFARLDFVDRTIALHVETNTAKFEHVRREEERLFAQLSAIDSSIQADVEKLAASYSAKEVVVQGQMQHMVADSAEKVSLALGATTVRFDAVERATLVAQEQLEKRLESVNEFRAQLRDQVGQFMTRTEMEAKMSAGAIPITNVIERLTTLETRAANFEGRMWAIGVGFTVIVTAISIALHFVH